jgi:tRNA G18 (ribose-2'-O)-methylase SpoU
MRRQVEHREQGIFVAEGEKVVRRLLESRLSVRSVLMPPKWLPEFETLLKTRAEEIRVFLAEKKLLETLTGFSMYQGLLAVAQVPASQTLPEILQSTARPWLLTATDKLSSAENMGALVRNCAAFEAHALMVSENCCSPFLRRAVRNSMGTIFHLPIRECSNLVQELQLLKSMGVRCIAAHPHANGRTLPEAELSGDVCLIFGSEGFGISTAVLELCDDAVAIPMPATVDSLNVASAAAAFLYEAGRQRARFHH